MALNFPRSETVPLIIKIENNNCFSLYTRSDLSNTRSQHLVMKTTREPTSI